MGGGWESSHLERDDEMTTEDSKTLPLLSLRNLVLFPGAVMPVEIGRPSSLRLIEALGGKGARVLVGTQKDADIEEPASSDLYTICVEGEVVRIVKAAENRVTAVLRGLERRRVTGFGFVLFCAVSVVWIVSGLTHTGTRIAVQNAILLLINAYGVWQYLLSAKNRKVMERMEPVAERIEKQVEAEEKA